MFNKALLLSFLPLFTAGMLGGISLLVIGATIKPPIRPMPPAPIGTASQLLVKLAILWSCTMGAYFALLVGEGSHGNVAWLLFVLSWPIVMSAAPLLAKTSRLFILICASFAILLSAFSFVSGFSIGSAYPLCAVLLVLAGAAQWRLTGSHRKSSLQETAILCI